MNVVTELLKSSLKLKPKIIALAECPLENEDWRDMKGFTCYADTKAAKYGCALYIRNEYVSMFVVGRITTQYVTLWSAGTEITFGYQRPNRHDWDTENEWHTGDRNVVIGDLNAKHRNWSAGSNAEGLKLNRWLQARNMEIRNRHIITMPTSRNAQGGTTIDLAISDPNTPCKANTIDISSAQHKALKIKIGIVWRKSQELALRYDKADWEKIKTELLFLDERVTDPDKVQKELTRIIHKHTPRARPNAKAFWNKDLETMRNKIKRERKKIPQNPTLPMMIKSYRQAIAKAKIEANGKSLQEETDPECFRRVKPTTTKRPIPALTKPDGTDVSEHPHRAEELQRALYGGEHRRPTPPKPTMTSNRITIAELDKAIKASPNGAATGPDDIPTRAIRELRKAKENLFLKMMNKAYTEGIPDSWKTSTTILIRKAKKDSYRHAKSWRPIQLQSILSKILERVIVAKLADLRLLSPRMFGGRKSNGTTDAIQALNDFVERNKGRNICLSALDVEGGFDHLDLNRTCNKIREHSSHLAQWIENWGHNRQTAYRFNGRTSRAFGTDLGTPQGSPLSPILFLISVKDVVDSETKTSTTTETDIFSYVDDILVATAYEDKREGQEYHQELLDQLSTKASAAGYKFSKQKGEYIQLHTKKNQHLLPNVEGTPLGKQVTMRWLGFIISEDWKWKQHMKHWIARATNTGYGISAMTSRYQVGGLNAWCTHRLIKGLVLPQLTYGIEVWENKAMIAEAQVALNKIVRSAYGIELKVPTIAIQTETGIPPLDLLTLGRLNTLALRAKFVGRDTNMTKRWLQDSGIAPVIEYATDQKTGKDRIKENIRHLWKEQIDQTDIRYKGKPRASYKHLRGITRQHLREVIALRATAGWPYQKANGTRRQCECTRDIITPEHLFRFCGVVPHTNLQLHSNKTIERLVEWIESWPKSLRNTVESKAEDRAAYRKQTAGATINIPTSQPSQRLPSTPAKNIRKHTACEICGKAVQANKVARDKHARTHLPGYTRGGKRINGPSGAGTRTGAAGPVASGHND